MGEKTLEGIHVFLIALGLIGSLVALYASFRLLKFKDEFKTEMADTIKANCASKEAFEAHEKSDVTRFESVEKNSAQRHDEVREDIGKVTLRIDALMQRKA